MTITTLLAPLSVSSTAQPPAKKLVQITLDINVSSTSIQVQSHKCKRFYPSSEPQMQNFYQIPVQKRSQKPQIQEEDWTQTMCLSQSAK
jgi:hypothetical protein